MEQDYLVYEFRMGPERFVFEAHNDRDAAKFEKYALIHFQDCLGTKFSQGSLEGPYDVSKIKGSVTREDPRCLPTS
jgi:hypothetical protein